MGGSSVWLCLCSRWVPGCVPRCTCWPTFLLAFCVKSFRFDTSWVLFLGFFPNTACLSQFALSKCFSLTCADQLCRFFFFLLVCIHTEIWVFCILMSTCGSIIHCGKKVKTEWSFSFEMLHLEIYFLPAAVIENCLSFFTIIFIPCHIVFN